MHEPNCSKLFGLSRRERLLLRALFEAGLVSGPLPAWAGSRASRRALRQLRARDLVQNNLRLTLSGLVVAANLPALGRSRLSLAA